MAETIEQRLSGLGVTLPAAAAPAANYVPFMQSDKLLLTAGQLPLKDGKLAVWIVDPAAKSVSLRAVEAENFENEKLVIRDGLKPDEVVVTEGGKFLFSGVKVSVAETAQ